MVELHAVVEGIVAASHGVPDMIRRRVLHFCNKRRAASSSALLKGGDRLGCKSATTGLRTKTPTFNTLLQLHLES